MLSAAGRLSVDVVLSVGGGISASLPVAGSVQCFWSRLSGVIIPVQIAAKSLACDWISRE